MSATGQPTATVPVDLETMRETVSAVLNADGGPVLPEPSDTHVAVLAELLRGHLEVMVREVETAAGKLPDTIPRYCALACVGEARGKLRAAPVARPGGAVVYARRLARVLAALCDHHELMAGDAR
ncbi:DUF6415 family natural product biosynthesis protein [Streptomyces sp. AC602_WCS936]|uniref:DUF6415 family natural product biosynthesis protein n=1 Tax=Streptomyces sp. AC602_WCS936 TaxID=2823685 RepID=UPI001C26AC4E|nr:DUF6415 family natural product biosynthesis protein [Streptomyces sp. AC602_WCS936]